MTTDRVKFDIACALSIVSPGKKLPNIFPDPLAIEDKLAEIFEACVDPESFKDFRCKIREGFRNPKTINWKSGPTSSHFAPGERLSSADPALPLNCTIPR